MEIVKRSLNRLIAGLVVLLLVSGPAGIFVTPAKGDGTGDYPPPETGDWVITRETVITNETIVLNGNLIIESDANLILNNGSIIFNCSYDGEFGVTVKSGGELQVFGIKELTPEV